MPKTTRSGKTKVDPNIDTSNKGSQEGSSTPTPTPTSAPPKIKAKIEPVEDTLDSSSGQPSILEQLRSIIVEEQQKLWDRMEALDKTNKDRLSKLESKISSLEPSIERRFIDVEQRVLDDEAASQASIQELQERMDAEQELTQTTVQDMKQRSLNNEQWYKSNILELQERIANDEASAANNIQSLKTKQEELQKEIHKTKGKEKMDDEFLFDEMQMKDRFNIALRSKVLDKLALQSQRQKEIVKEQIELENQVKAFTSQNNNLAQKLTNLENEIKIKNKRLKELNHLVSQNSKRNSLSEPQLSFIDANDKLSPENSPSRRTSTSMMDGIEIVEPQPTDYENEVPKFDGEEMNVDFFILRLVRHFDKYREYYNKNLRFKTMYIEDHLEKTALKWYQMDEMYSQQDNPQPDILIEKIKNEFKIERSKEEVQMTMLKLRHSWGKAYEYLSEFNRYSRILGLDDNTKKLIMLQQVRPSIAELFYELPEEKQTLEGFVACLRSKDAFPKEVKIEKLERHNFEAERKAAIFGLLGMMDPRKPSVRIETYKRSLKDGKRENKESTVGKSNIKDLPKDKKTEPYSQKNNGWKNKRSVSNNPIPKTSLMVQESKYSQMGEPYKPEAIIYGLNSKFPRKNLEVLYDTGSHINIIHPKLAEELKLKIEKKPSYYKTAAGKTLIPYVTEEFMVKLKLVDETTNSIKWYSYPTRCRLAEAMPNNIILGSRFMDKHFIYRKIDRSDFKPKVYKMEGEKSGLPDVDSVEDAAKGDIYIVQDMEDNNKPMDGRVNKIIERVIEMKKEKVLIEELIKRFYREKEFKEAERYINSITDDCLHKQEISKVGNMSDGVSMFSIPEDKNKDKPVSLNPIADIGTSNQEIVNDSTSTKQEKVHPEVNKVQKELDLSAEEIVDKYYANLKEAFNEDIANTLPEHRPYDCKIELEPDAGLHRGSIYPINQKEEKALKEYIEENLAKGFIRKSDSPAGHPVLFTPKKTGDLRLCTDYRKLNKVTVRNAYPLPRISSVFESMKGAVVFSKLDLKSAYNLVRIREGDEYKTAFNTKFGHYEYLVMPFGLTNAPAVFQSFINTVFEEDIGKFCQVYLDDIIIYSKTLDEHIQHVRTILDKLIQNKLVAKMSKCEFHKLKIPFLGHVVSREGVETDPEKLKAVAEWPKPKNVKQLLSFLGFCNYYRNFIENFADISKPLYRMTSKKATFKWNEERDRAFETLKRLLVSPPVLSYPDPDKQFIVECDASNYAIGGVLSQIGEDGKLHPIYYYSKTLKKAEINYSITEKELLAIKTAFVEWRHLLQGATHKILVYSDHRNLLFATKPQLLTPRQVRWQELFATYWFDIIYRPGKKNGKADELSRIEDPDQPSREPDKDSILKPSQLIDFNEDEACYVIIDTNFVDDIKQNYRTDKLAQEILADLKKQVGGDYNKKHWIEVDGLIVRQSNPEQVYVPTQLRKSIIQLNHDSEFAGHLGIDKTVDLILRNYFWPKMRQDIAGYIKHCTICRTKKDDRHAPYGKAVRAPIPDLPWQEIQMDFITDLPVKNRSTNIGCDENLVQRGGCILVCSDKLTKMIHLMGFRHLPSAKETANTFLKEIYRLHGFPISITTDRGTQFTSKVWKDLMKFFGAELNLATTSHHETVGQVERNNSYVETYLRCFVNTFDNDEWLDYLYLAEFCYNNSIHASTNQSPFLSLYNYQVHNSPQTADLVHSLGEMKIIDSFAHNLGNFKHMLEISRTRYLDIMDQHRSDNYPRYKLLDLVWLKKPSIL